MKELRETLDRLSDEASGGPWDCRGHNVWTAGDEPLRMDYNATGRFIVALVNAWRDGELVLRSEVERVVDRVEGRIEFLREHGDTTACFDLGWVAADLRRLAAGGSR